MNSKLLVALNFVTLAIMIYVNYASSTGLFANATVAEISYRYDTLFAPAGYAFIIWGVIFLLCICFVAYQVVLLRKNDPDQLITKSGLWFSLSNIANMTWLFCWTNEWLGWSVILIILLLLFLIKITINLRLNLSNKPALFIFFVKWPIVLYMGWIMVATVACIASWLVKSKWNGFNFSQEIWTISMISIAAMLYLILIIKPKLNVAAMVGVWALIAIAVRQWDNHPIISGVALAWTMILFSLIVIYTFRSRKNSIS